MQLIIAGLLSVLATFVGRVLVSLLIGYVEYRGIDTAMQWLMNGMITHINALPAQIVGIIGLLKVGTCVNIIASAITARMTINGLKNGAIKKMRFK